jgi:hypothetical protein
MYNEKDKKDTIIIFNVQTIQGQNGVKHYYHCVDSNNRVVVLDEKDMHKYKLVTQELVQEPIKEKQQSEQPVLPKKK